MPGRAKSPHLPVQLPQHNSVLVEHGHAALMPLPGPVTLARARGSGKDPCSPVHLDGRSMDKHALMVGKQGSEEGQGQIFEWIDVGTALCVRTAGQPRIKPQFGLLAVK